MTSLKGTPEEELIAAIFGEKPWDPSFPLYYPYIVVEEDGEKRTLRLVEAIRETLSTLPPVKSRKHSREYEGHRQVLELRFGLQDGLPKTLKKTGQELGGISLEQVRKMQAKALRLLRHPSRSRRLREFFVPSPEEMARKHEQLRDLREELYGAEVRIDRLVTILKGCGLGEKDFEEVAPEDIPQTAQALREEQEDKEALQALIVKFPNNLVWNAIKRHNRSNDAGRIDRLSLLQTKVLNGEILQVRQIGAKGVMFLKQALQAVEQVVPS